MRSRMLALESFLGRSAAPLAGQATRAASSRSASNSGSASVFGLPRQAAARPPNFSLSPACKARRMTRCPADSYPAGSAAHTVECRSTRICVWFGEDRSRASAQPASAASLDRGSAGSDKAAQAGQCRPRGCQGSEHSAGARELAAVKRRVRQLENRTGLASRRTPAHLRQSAGTRRGTWRPLPANEIISE